VLDSEWPHSVEEKEPRLRGVDYMLDCISHLGGLKTVQILWRESEFVSEESMEVKDEGPKWDVRDVCILWLPSK
jgi:hypothetical protein